MSTILLTGAGQRGRGFSQAAARRQGYMDDMRRLPQSDVATI